MRLIEALRRTGPGGGDDLDSGLDMCERERARREMGLMEIPGIHMEVCRCFA